MRPPSPNALPLGSLLSQHEIQVRYVYCISLSLCMSLALQVVKSATRPIYDIKIAYYSGKLLNVFFLILINFILGKFTISK